MVERNEAWRRDVGRWLDDTPEGRPEIGKKEEPRATTLRPTVVVGLGGTGQAIVSRVKEQIRTYQGAEDSVIKFLVFDTDQKDSGSSLDDQEFCYLGDFDGDDVVKRLHASPDIAAWISPDLRPGFVREGTHCVRPVGRLALFWNFVTVKDYLRKAVTDSRAIFRHMGETAEGRTIKVYIVSSLCGGHGSGTFLDTAYYLRYLIHNEFTARPVISGIFMMPEPFMSRVQDIQNQARLKANTYAALKELEHFVDARDFSCRYPAYPPIRVQNVPFDTIYLIDNVNEVAQVVPDIEDLFTMVAVQLYLELLTPLGEEQTSFLDNLLRNEPHLPTGKPKAFASFAVGALQFPVDNIHRYLAFKAGRELIENKILEPTDERAVASMVTGFVTEKKIRGHKANDVVDALNLTPEGRRVFVGLNDSAVDVAATSLQTQVSTLENTLMPQRLEQKKQGMKKTRDALLNRVLEGLRDQLGTIVRIRGLRFAQHFMEQLRQEVRLYKMKMDDEREDARTTVDTYQGQVEKLVVRQLPDDLRAGFLVRGGRIRGWKAEYLPARRRLNTAVLEEANRGLASGLFATLDAELENRLHRLQVLIGQMEATRDRFGAAAEHYGPRRVDEGTRRFEVIQEVTTRDDVNRYYQPQQTTLAEFAEQTDVLTRWIHSDAEPPDVHRPKRQPRQKREVLELALQIFDYCYGKYSHLQNTDSHNIREFLNRSGVRPSKDEVKDLLDRCWPFWSWDGAVLGAEEHNLPYHFALGLFSDAWKEDLEPEMVSPPTVVSTGNPNMIMASKVAHGLPLFALIRIKHYSFFYQRYLDDPRRPLHLQDDWADWPDLLPQDEHGIDLDLEQ